MLIATHDVFSLCAIMCLLPSSVVLLPFGQNSVRNSLRPHRILLIPPQLVGTRGGSPNQIAGMT